MPSMESSNGRICIFVKLGTSPAALTVTQSKLLLLLMKKKFFVIFHENK